MINIDEVYRLVNNLATKNGGQYLSPSEFNEYTQMASSELFDRLIGRKDQPVTVYGRNRNTDSRLKPFRVTEDIALTNGIGDLPDDWEKTNAVHTTGDSPIPVRQTDEDRFARLFDNPLASPTEDDPFYIENQGTIEVYPKTITSVTMRYLKRPTKAVWAYTLNGRKPVYDPAASVNLEWNESEKMEIVIRILNYLGISMRDGNIVNYTETKQAQE